MSTAAPQGADLGILLNLAFGAVKLGLHARLAAAGFDDLGPSFGYVLRVLDGESPSLADLARRLGITPQGAWKIVDTMIAKGYARRVGDARDRRITRLTLAPRGRRCLAEARRYYAAFERALGRRLGSGRVRVARGVLEAVVADAAGAGLELQARPF
jgi:DNA-binding MarR family transcriptional regulator